MLFNKQYAARLAAKRAAKRVSSNQSPEVLTKGKF